MTLKLYSIITSCFEFYLRVVETTPSLKYLTHESENDEKSHKNKCLPFLQCYQ